MRTAIIAAFIFLVTVLAACSGDSAPAVGNIRSPTASSTSCPGTADSRLYIALGD